MGEYQGRRVAVKVLKVYSTSDFNKVINVGCLRSALNVRVGKLTLTYAEVLQGSHDVENPSPSERVTTAGSDDGREPFRNGIGMDGKRKHQRVCQGAQGRESV